MNFDRAAFTQFLEEAIPFNRLLGLRLEVLEEGRVVLRLPFKEQHIGDVFRPALHGGAIAATIDAAAGAAAFTLITVSDRLATIDLRIDYLRPAPRRDLLATATVRRMGKRTCVVDVAAVPDGESDSVADGRGVFNVVRNVGNPRHAASAAPGAS